jgi:hypothetical protein
MLYRKHERKMCVCYKALSSLQMMITSEVLKWQVNNMFQWNRLWAFLN